MDVAQKDKSDSQKRKGEKKEIRPTGQKKKNEFEEGGNLFACPRFPTHCAQSSQSGKHAALPSCQRPMSIWRGLSIFTHHIQGSGNCKSMSAYNGWVPVVHITFFKIVSMLLDSPNLLDGYSSPIFRLAKANAVLGLAWLDFLVLQTPSSLSRNILSLVPVEVCKMTTLELITLLRFSTAATFGPCYLLF